MVDSNQSPNNGEEIKAQTRDNSSNDLNNSNVESLKLQLQEEQLKNQQLTSTLLATQQKLSQLETEFEQRLEAQLDQKIFELELCYDLSRQIGSTLSYEDLFRSMLKYLHTVVPCDVTGGILLEPKICELFLNANRPLATTAQLEIQQRLVESMLKVNGLDLLNLPLCLHNLNYQIQSSSELQIQQIGSHFFVPIIAHFPEEKQIVGLLFVGTEKAKQFTEEHIRILYKIANQASTYVQQLQMLLQEEKNRLENKRIRQALAKEKEFNELKTRIVRTISHEYRTPLTIISLAVDLLESQEGKLSLEQKEACFHKIRTATEHMTNLVEDVLVVDQVESKEVIFAPSHINLFQLCQQLVNNFRVTPAQKHQILFDYQGEQENIYLDENIVRQILTHLLSNAVKYSTDGGLINLNVKGSCDQVILQVCDRGIGIPPEDRSSLFECFHRATNVGTLPGTGLGLAIVKKYVEIHQGEICFESELNVGTIFTITLPIVNC
ncbi:GAF sensor signal transduction histidine kinase [Stanieria cyanosphaera PCC 7437]|uniref:histidine kinase n=1 Tax=Stanieria cyanosphaera (strain ATCC 29371 / PCC 7437) TaxID=111780 RepID=K9XUF7_STAC7|nr:GAF domain-containing sensor histidine kinase [Stanieria cyanosphaera]AFZ35694.1 GAF sensor signal transduction histidine kinase [Stanieria cyanosphaera PCC 7437]